jgi:hypothetical protein
VAWAVLYSVCRRAPLLPLRDEDASGVCAYASSRTTRAEALAMQAGASHISIARQKRCFCIRLWDVDGTLSAVMSGIPFRQ